jgi:hypothetical protein
MRDILEEFAHFLYHVFRGSFYDPQYQHEIEGYSYISLILPYTLTLAAVPTPFIFAQEINYVTIQNNTEVTLYYGLDEVAYPGTLMLPAGGFVWWAKRCQSVSIYTATAQPINTYSNNGIVLRGSL